MLDIQLVKETHSSLTEVVGEVIAQSQGTSWAKQSSAWVIDEIKSLEKYGDHWTKGFLPQEYLGNILLPRHGYHDKTKKYPDVLCDKNCPLAIASKSYQERIPNYCPDCIATIEYLKKEISQHGFIQPITLIILDDALKHVDGLHRLIALKVLINEGFQYQPIPVFLCKPKVS